jgi:class 3 adenylate cyclase/tetratricopeptide (TPR) repeat protein
MRGNEHTPVTACYVIAAFGFERAGRVSVKAWLTELGFAHYAEAFAENGVDLSLLPELTNEDLKDLGVNRLADRKTILKAIAGLLEGEVRPSATAPESAATGGERRQVTVLFADLSDFTELSNELGAEATHDLLNRYFETVDGIIQGYGGMVDKHIGDNVMAVFGAPIAHTDDPERALRAALDIHQAMTRLSEKLGRNLTAHIGVASGQVVASGTGSEAHREYTVTGKTVNLASRLQDLAKGGETLISKEVQRLTAQIVASTSRGSVTVKGFSEQVELWTVDRLTSEAPLHRATSFVGRRMELGQFTALLDEVLRHGQGHTLLVRGEPGIGKTRLIEEFDRIAQAKALSGHRGLILDFGVAKGHDAIRDLVASMLSLGPDEDSAGRQETARRAVADGLVSPDNRTFLHAFLGIPPPPETRELFDAMDVATRKQGAIETIGELIGSLCDHGALLLIVEDIHWADQSTLDLLAGIAAAVANVPALLVMTTRVEGLVLERGWLVVVGDCPATTMDLRPLRREESLRLAADLAGDGLGALEALVRRSEGNPLFLEELVQNAAEASGQDLPDTLQGLVLARVDRLDRKDREAIQAAAVLGQRFSLDALHHVLDTTGYECTELLQHRIVRPEGPYYLFAHALLRDGVYTSLLQARRQDLHKRAAEYFAKRDAVLHAEHLDRAASPAASRAYLAAAQEEADHVRYENALRLVARALEITPQAESVALQLLRGELLRGLGSIPESMDAYQEARTIAQGASERCHALIGVAEGLRLKDEHGELLQTLDAAEAVAKTEDLLPELARILQLRGSVYFVRGEIEACLKVNERSLKLARDAQAPELEAQALGGLGEAEFARGHMISAYKRYDECIALGRKHGFLRVVAANLSMRGQTLNYMNDLASAMADCREAVELARRIRQPRAEMIAAIVAAYITELHDPIEGEKWSRSSLEIARRLGARLFESINLEYLGRFAAQAGDLVEAEDLVQKAITIVRESDSGMRFLAGRSFGALALVTQDVERSWSALKEGEELLRRGAPAHNHLWFHRDAIEVCLRCAQWDGVEKYVKALETYSRAEPLPWSDFFVARGRALAAFGRGRRDDEIVLELQRLRDEAEQVGLKNALPALEEALMTCR